MEEPASGTCDGTAYGSIQFTEEDTGSDPGALRTTAKQSGNSYIINGMKRFSTFGDRDGVAILYARDETEKCSAFVIEKNVKGYKVSKNWKLMGSGGIEATDVYFEDMKVPRKNLLGNKGQGFAVLLFWIAMEKIQQCAACVSSVILDCYGKNTTMRCMCWYGPSRLGRSD